MITNIFRLQAGRKLVGVGQKSGVYHVVDAKTMKPVWDNIIGVPSEVGGIVRSAPEGSGFAPGDRVAGFCVLGGFAEVAVSPVAMTFPLPESLDFAQGAALVLN